MLHSDTRRHINAARQVLVGVVPNPTSQIDQITSALLYKFMDDMDQAAIKVGGKPSFFIDDLEHYAWARIMRPSVGNQERMNLYSEALTKFSRAKQLPELFRDIFADSFLPYRSPETLGLFLNEIDYFDYSHPEELGNAYEYLLSIMSSQGGAGQFRTPRNIIDFIVDVVNPTKDDKILDPACGTAGFLVSSYRHILEQHDGINDPEKKEKPLTPDERKKLMNNLEGYDIDPGMARIARVNMYLHQFKNPKIHRYDALSSDERWKDKFSVILANPPFMSPKGGIRPHSKFGIPSSRSEVLFVDYIMEHLRPNGRAGIIVPEGIIFQSGTAYKQLRKKLVEDGLYAVVSLPSGVFQPYSGVKTSILLFNNEVAKQRKEILFVKVENDGFALGATRQRIDKNDLPTALGILNKWRIGEKSENKLALYIKKTEIAEDGKYDLTGDHYQKTENYSNVKWPMVELGDLEKQGKIKFLRGQGISKKDILKDGQNKCIHYGEIYTLYQPIIKNVISRTDFEGKVFSKKGDVLIPSTTTADAMGIAVARSLNEDDVILGGDINIIRTENDYVLSDYLALLISTPPLKNQLATYAKGANILHISNSDIKKLKIPLPKIEFQEQIVLEIDQYQKVIDGAKQVVQNWKPYFRVDPEWPMVTLEEVAEVIAGQSPKGEYYNTVGEGIPFYQGKTEFSEVSIGKPRVWTTSTTKIAENGDILMSVRAPVGPVNLATERVCIGRGLASIRAIKINRMFLFYYLKSIEEDIRGDGGAVFDSISKTKIMRLSIPLPSLEVQEQIVAEIEAEQKAINESKNLIGAMKKKIESKIAEVWGE